MFSENKYCSDCKISLFGLAKNTAGVVEKKKIERKNRRKPCEHCNMWSHQEDKCFRKNPSIAPEEWRKKAEELIYEDMDFNAKLAYATASREEKREERYKPLGPASREWEEAKKEFEKVERFRREEKTKERERSPTCKNSVWQKNSDLVHVMYSLDEIEDRSDLEVKSKRGRLIRRFTVM